ncbi:hypothetical protein FACS189454_04220 [Planctomycetales bacterium]|nr:hypothetical protein FACS189454_04220 [Planctomycetales bacterium]
MSEGFQIVGLFGATVNDYSLNLTNSTGTVWNPITVGQGQPATSQEMRIDSLDSSRNINVGAIGAVNMTLATSWKANAANDDPAWADGSSDAEKERLRTVNLDSRYGGDYSSAIYGDQPELNGGVISMVAYDVTNLIRSSFITLFPCVVLYCLNDRVLLSYGQSRRQIL